MNFVLKPLSAQTKRGLLLPENGYSIFCTAGQFISSSVTYISYKIQSFPFLSLFSFHLAEEMKASIFLRDQMGKSLPCNCGYLCCQTVHRPRCLWEQRSHECNSLSWLFEVAFIMYLWNQYNWICPFLCSGQRKGKNIPIARRLILFYEKG